MTEKTRKQIEAMKQQTIGVEIEMAKITREKACRTVAKFFGTEHTVYRNGNRWYCTDTLNRKWTVAYDSSISGDGAELITPILTYADIEDLQKITRLLRKAGAKSNPSLGCGVHVHIGANGHTPQSLRNLANIMASHEHLLARAINIDAHRGQPHLLGKAERCKAHHDERACGDLVLDPRRRFQERTLQPQPLPYAQPPRDLHQGHD